MLRVKVGVRLSVRVRVREKVRVRKTKQRRSLVTLGAGGGWEGDVLGRSLRACKVRDGVVVKIRVTPRPCQQITEDQDQDQDQDENKDKDKDK